MKFISILICLLLLGKPGLSNDFLNVEQVIVKEHGWEKYWLGPVGQTYTIDLAQHIKMTSSAY